MNKITQTARYRQSLIHYAQKNGVTAAAIRYRTNRQYIYRWMKRYDGTLQSLEDRSHRPHSHPRQHKPEEIKLIDDMRRRNPHAGLVVFWVKLRQRGYSRSISGLYRFLRKRGQMAVKPPNPKYIPKPYEKMAYPGQRVQIDVKYVPQACLVGEAVNDARLHSQAGVQRGVRASGSYHEGTGKSGSYGMWNHPRGHVWNVFVRPASS